MLFAGRGIGNPDLFQINTATGLGTFIGSSGLGFAAISGMAFDSTGTLFASVNITGDGSTGGDHLATIDPASGVATVIGPFGTCTGVEIPSEGGGSCTIEGIEGIAFDPSGQLFGTHSTRGSAGASGLYTIDTSTGAATFAAPILDESGIAPSGGVVGLEFVGNVLYGGTARALAPATDGGRLVTIDPNTGLFAFVGSVSATGGSSLGALALVPTFSSPPVQAPGVIISQPLIRPQELPLSSDHSVLAPVSKYLARGEVHALSKGSKGSPSIPRASCLAPTAPGDPPGPQDYIPSIRVREQPPLLPPFWTSPV